MTNSYEDKDDLHDSDDFRAQWHLSFKDLWW